MHYLIGTTWLRIVVKIIQIVLRIYYLIDPENHALNSDDPIEPVIFYLMDLESAGLSQSERKRNAT